MTNRVHVICYYFFFQNAERLFLEGKQTAYRYFKGICDIHQRVKGDGCRHIRSFNIADMCAADAHHLGKLKLIQPLEFSIIGDVQAYHLVFLFTALCRHNTKPFYYL